MDITNPSKQPTRVLQPEPRTRWHRQAQSVIPQSVTTKSEANQSVSPQSELSLTEESASPQTQSHLENPQLKSVSSQSVHELLEAAKRAIDPTASMTNIVAQSGRNLVARKKSETTPQ